MKTYTVKQISEMLDTNEETVRRWIRRGKLVASKTSKKDGNVVTKEDFENFIETMPKYKEKVDFNDGKGILGIASKIISINDEKKNDGDEMYNDKFVSFLISDIEKIKESIANREELINQTKEEIKELKVLLNKYEKKLHSMR